MEMQFRKATFGGFNRQDVVDYLEKTSKEHTAQVEELQARIAQLEEDSQKLTSLQEEHTTLESRYTQDEQELESLQAKLKGAQGEIDTLRQANKEGQEKIFALTPDAEAYRAIKERAAGMELDAHLRAQKTIADAEKETQQLEESCRQRVAQLEEQCHQKVSQMEAECNQQVTQMQGESRQWITGMHNQYGAARGTLDTALSQALAEMKQSQTALETLVQTMGQHDAAMEELVVSWLKKLNP